MLAAIVYLFASYSMMINDFPYDKIMYEHTNM